MASKNIRGITIQIGADVTQLDKGLKTADKSIKQVQNELKEVEKALKLNPKNTELVAQKQQLLAEQVSKTSEKLSMLKNAQEQVEDQFKSGKITGEQYRAFQRELANTESELRSVRREQSAYNAEQGAARQASERLTAQMKTLADGLKNVANACTKVAGTALKGVELSFKAVAEEVKLGVKALEAYVTGLTTAATAVAGFAVKSGASFEQSMSKVQSLSGATGDDLKALEDKAREMGASTSKSASEAADALGYMALAGWNNQQMLEGLEPVLRASEAGQMDLATCSDLVTDSMSAMGIQTSELTHYLDVVTKTQSSANTSMQGMLEAYIGCGGTLKNLEVPLEESATLIGVLANRGIKGSEAGTSLNSVLVNLMGSGGQAAEALESLGVSMYDVDGNRKGVTTTLRELDEALKNCSESERDVFTAHIGGKTQMDTLQALLAGLNEEYGDLNGKLQDVDGTLINTAKAMQENFNGAVTEAKSALEGLGLSIYNTFSADLTKNIRGITGYISMISEAVQRGNVADVITSITKGLGIRLKQGLEEFAQNTAEISAIFNAVILGIVNVATYMLPSLTSQILPVLLRGMFDLVNGLIERLPEIVSVLLDLGARLITGILEGMNESAGLLAETLPEILQTAFDYLTDNLPFIITAGFEIILTLINAITAMLPDLIPMAISLIITISKALIDNLDKIIDSAVELIITLCDALLENLDPLIDASMDIIVAIVKALVDNLDKIIEVAITILITLGAALIDFAGRLTDYIPELITKIQTSFMDYDWAGLGGRIMQSIFDGINKIGENASNLLASAGEHILDALGFHPDGTFSLPFFAEGGVLTSGSAIVGEAGPELLSVSNGRAVVTPLTNGSGYGMAQSPVYYINNTVNVERIDSDYDIKRINEQLAVEQRNAMDAVGGW